MHITAVIDWIVQIRAIAADVETCLLLKIIKSTMKKNNKFVYFYSRDELKSL